MWHLLLRNLVLLSGLSKLALVLKLWLIRRKSLLLRLLKIWDELLSVVLVLDLVVLILVWVLVWVLNLVLHCSLRQWHLLSRLSLLLLNLSLLLLLLLLKRIYSKIIIPSGRIGPIKILFLLKIAWSRVLHLNQQLIRLVDGMVGILCWCSSVCTCQASFPFEKVSFVARILKTAHGGKVTAVAHSLR